MWENAISQPWLNSLVKRVNNAMDSSRLLVSSESDNLVTRNRFAKRKWNLMKLVASSMRNSQLNVKLKLVLQLRLLELLLVVLVVSASVVAVVVVNLHSKPQLHR
jgi:hypothetical protein